MGYINFYTDNDIVLLLFISYYSLTNKHQPIEFQANPMVAFSTESQQVPIQIILLINLHH